MGWTQQGRRKSLNLSQCIISIPSGILLKKVEFNLHCLWISTIISKNSCLTYAFFPDSWQNYSTDTVLVKYLLAKCAFINNPFPSYWDCNTFMGQNLGMSNTKVTLGNWSWLMAAESSLMLLAGHLISCLLLCRFFSKMNSISQFPNCHRSMIRLSLLISSSLWCKDLSEWLWSCQVNATPLNYPRESAPRLTRGKAVCRNRFLTFMPPPCVSTTWTHQTMFISQKISTNTDFTHGAALVP